jgi:hypothetical protein
MISFKREHFSNNFAFDLPLTTHTSEWSLRAALQKSPSRARHFSRN